MLFPYFVAGLLIEEEKEFQYAFYLAGEFMLSLSKAQESSLWPVPMGQSFQDYSWIQDNTVPMGQSFQDYSCIQDFEADFLAKSWIWKVKIQYPWVKVFRIIL